MLASRSEFVALAVVLISAVVLTIAVVLTLGARPARLLKSREPQILKDLPHNGGKISLPSQAL